MDNYSCRNADSPACHVQRRIFHKGLIVSMFYKISFSSLIYITIACSCGDAQTKSATILMESSETNQALFPFIDKGKWGYMNRSLSVIIPPSFLSASDFKDDRAVVSKDGKTYGFIDREGNFAVQPQYDMPLIIPRVSPP